jgi:uncharacterized membrane protein YphA (DoxX/SURF4 family)
MTRYATTTRRANAALWTIQALLALTFLFAGVMKFVIPVQVMEQQSHLPGLFIRFIGICEVLGALGLVLPGIFRIRTELTGLAAAGLVILMTGATSITVAGGQVGGAILPLIVGVLAAIVLRSRWQGAPVAQTLQPTVLRRAA